MVIVVDGLVFKSSMTSFSTSAIAVGEIVRELILVLARAISLIILDEVMLSIDLML